MYVVCTCGVCVLVLVFVCVACVCGVCVLVFVCVFGVGELQCERAAVLENLSFSID